MGRPDLALSAGRRLVHVAAASPPRRSIWRQCVRTDVCSLGLLFRTCGQCIAVLGEPSLQQILCVLLVGREAGRLFEAANACARASKPAPTPAKRSTEHHLVTATNARDRALKVTTGASSHAHSSPTEERTRGVAHVVLLRRWLSSGSFYRRRCSRAGIGRDPRDARPGHQTPEVGHA